MKIERYQIGIFERQLKQLAIYEATTPDAAYHRNPNLTIEERLMLFDAVTWQKQRLIEDFMLISRTVKTSKPEQYKRLKYIETKYKSAVEIEKLSSAERAEQFDNLFQYVGKLIEAGNFSEDVKTVDK